MANNDDIILRGKALKDLRGIQDVLMSQGDPFLAGVINRAIKCIENQPSVYDANPELVKVAKTLCGEYEKAKNNPVVRNQIAYALFQTWKKYDR